MPGGDLFFVFAAISEISGARRGRSRQRRPLTKKKATMTEQIAEERLSENHQKPHAEQQYLDLIERIMREGVQRDDRTGTGTLSVFGATMRFDLSESFPLFTTKRVFWRGVVEELLFFIRGETDGRKLLEKKITFWEPNGRREALDARGLQHRKEHDLGPIYGWQWRHFGARYIDCETDYGGRGLDQLQAIVETIKANPNDRRMVLSAWNPVDLDAMALPPCHMICQFYVADGKLSCLMNQRSCDMGLGVPFNVASYALLTCILAHFCNLAPGEFIHVLGDAHVYLNHVEPLREQLKRRPLPLPTLRIAPKKTIERIEDYTFDDFELSNYKCHAKIKMDISV